jgi:hypothetical protein
VRSLSPFRTQLEHLAAAFERGEQYSQTQNAAVQQAVPIQPTAVQQPAHAAPQ